LLELASFRRFPFDRFTYQLARLERHRKQDAIRSDQRVHRLTRGARLIRRPMQETVAGIAIARAESIGSGMAIAFALLRLRPMAAHILKQASVVVTLGSSHRRPASNIRMLVVSMGHLADIVAMASHRTGILTMLLGSNMTRDFTDDSTLARSVAAVGSNVVAVAFSFTSGMLVGMTLLDSGIVAITRLLGWLTLDTSLLAQSMGQLVFGGVVLIRHLHRGRDLWVAVLFCDYYAVTAFVLALV
jgi:hypothetical protein